ncbi:hypothetical protein HY630_03775 [Candidatus Uhrbacteria bacterium]|nr:hypothetical protein [Candidatus Uhrbacteria bacterium]
MATTRAQRRHLKNAGYKNLRLTDSAADWSLYLGVTPKDAASIKAALERIIPLNVGKKESPDELLNRAVKNLLDAAHGGSAYFLCLADAETYGLRFSRLDDVTTVFGWIQVQYEQWLREANATKTGRVNRDERFWKGFNNACYSLLSYFEGHWNCDPSDGVLDAQTIIDTFDLLGVVGVTFQVCAFLRIVRASKQVGIEQGLLKSLVLNHHCTRINDFAALMEEGLLTQSTYWELASRPALVEALSYSGLKLLLSRWKAGGGELLAFARSMVDELYPQGVPRGTNPHKSDWPFGIIEFLKRVQEDLAAKDVLIFSFHVHTKDPGIYTPGNAQILLAEPEPDDLLDIALEVLTHSDDPECVEVEIDDPPEPTDEPSLEPTPEAARDADVHDLWLEQFAARAAMNAARLAAISNQVEPEPVHAPTAWEDVHDLIVMDAHEGQEGVEDSGLQALLADLGEIEHLLDLAARGDTDGVLGLWSAWIDPIRDRVHAVDARLKELASRPTEVIEVVLAPEPSIAPEPSAPEPTPAPAPPQVAPPAQKHPPFPEGDIGALFLDAYNTLARLPSGAMKRQLKSQLEALRTEALSDGSVRSLKPRVAAIQKEVIDFLDILN